MRSHAVLLTLFSLLVATVFAALLRNNFREQIRVGAVIFAGLVISAVVAGWLMYPIPL